MSSNISKDSAKDKDSAKEHHQPMMLFLAKYVSIALIVLSALLGLRLIKDKISFNSVAEKIFQGGTASNTPLSNGIAPVSIQIPALNISTAVVPVNVDANNQLLPPDQTNAVGWYQKGPYPGELGPAVLDGHLDWYNGPAIFYNLKRLQPGDQIRIKLNNGEAHTFQVTSKQNYSQDNFPTQAVYGQINYPGLRLITCSGTYDHSAQRYSDNLVVYARMTN